MILTGHVVRHKVHDDFHTADMCTFHQSLELFHAFVYVYRQVRVNVIIIFDGIGRACLSLDYRRMVFRNAVGRVVSLCGMSYQTGVPDVGRSQFLDLMEGLFSKIVHFPQPFSASVPFGRQPMFLLPNSRVNT